MRPPLSGNPIPKHVIDAVQCVYSDGGVKGNNPSNRGGSWAFVYVAEEKLTHSDSGIVKPTEIGLPNVSNNVTELVGLLLALEPLPDGWSGDVFTDSLVTLRRFDSMTAKMNGIPDFLANRVRAVVDRMNYRLTLLAGHPTKEHLKAGFKIKDSGNKYPVSRWNVLCDSLCGEALKTIP